MASQLADLVHSARASNIGTVKIDGGVYALRLLTMEETAEFVAFQKAHADDTNSVMRLLIQMVLSTPDGNRLVSDPITEDEQQALASMPMRTTVALFSACVAHNRIGTPAAEADAKNSERPPSTSS